VIEAPHRRGRRRTKEKGQHLLALLIELVVPLDGIELSTFALRMRCSTN
jgi:hypothetical protein